MNYLILVAWAFVALAIYQPNHRKAWLVVAACTFAEGFIATLFASDWLTRQALRACTVFAAGYVLCYIKTTFSLYQAAVLLSTLIAYLALAVDVYAFRSPVLIYNEYKGIIYGLVVAQFMGFYIALRADIAHCCAGRRFSFKNLQRG